MSAASGFRRQRVVVGYRPCHSLFRGALLTQLLRARLSRECCTHTALSAIGTICFSSSDAEPVGHGGDDDDHE
jgi:hypothetical protein